MTDLIEMYAIPDTFCEEVYRVDRIGPCHRLIFTARDYSCETRCVVAKLILPSERLLDLAALARGAHAQMRTADYAPELLALPMASLAH